MYNFLFKKLFSFKEIIIILVVAMLIYAVKNSNNDFGSFIDKQLVVRVSKETNIFNNILGAFNCYFEIIDNLLSSQEGIQFLHDIGLVNKVELEDNID